MAYSTQRATSDGTMVLLDISVDYLDRSEITVYFNDVLTSAWMWSGTSDRRILFPDPVPNGIEVLVKRTTDASALRHKFSQGAKFTSTNLDEDLTQALHMAQEASEANLVGDFFTDINMHGFRVFNVGAAVNDSDVLTLAQYKADALGANAAAARAEAAADLIESGLYFDPTVNYVKGTLAYATQNFCVHARQFTGFVGDGVADDTAALQGILNFVGTFIPVNASAGTGNHFGTVSIAGCLIRLTAQLTIPVYIHLTGEDRLPDPSNGAQYFNTCFKVDWGSGGTESWTSTAVIMSHSSALSGVGFYYPGQVAKTATTPIAYGFSIGTNETHTDVKDNIRIKNVVLYNSYRGIRLRYCGRFDIDHVIGDPLALGIDVDNSFDTCYMTNVHFWDFYTQADTLENWVAANGTAFKIGRVDQLFASKLMTWNRDKGYHLYSTGWLNFTDIVCDKANTPVYIESTNQAKFNNVVLITNPAAKPAVVVKVVGEAVQFNNMRITNTGCVGVDIDSTVLGKVLFSNCAFDNRHTAAIVRSTTAEVRFDSSCTFTVPPWGSSNVIVDGSRLPYMDSDVSSQLTWVAEGAMTGAGPYTMSAASVTNGRVFAETTYFGQRCGQNILEFDFTHPAGFTTWYFQFGISSDVGTVYNTDFMVPVPLVVAPGSTSTKVRIPFFINHSRYKQIMQLRLVTTVAGTGNFTISNLKCYEQASYHIRDAQIGMLLNRKYCLDPFNLGQTVAARGPARFIVTDPEAGIGRAGAAPTAGTWDVGDTIVLKTPTAAGTANRAVCTTAGTPGTWTNYATP